MKKQYSDADYNRAKGVRKLQERLGFPSDADLANALEYNVLGPCEYNARDIMIANKLFGPSLANARGKMTERKVKIDKQEGKK